jgi:peptidoglycan/xylan/chitin deacetylase (PgdA/CDA1 family)
MTKIKTKKKKKKITFFIAAIHFIAPEIEDSQARWKEIASEKVVKNAGGNGP